MDKVVDLALFRQARWVREAFEAVKKGQRAQFRAAILDGRNVVVFGHVRARGDYEPMLVAVDGEIGRDLRGFRTVRHAVRGGAGAGGCSTKTAKAGADGRVPGDGSRRRRPPRNSHGVPAGKPELESRGKPGSLTWYAAQMNKAVDKMNCLDEGHPTGCRYATLGSEVVVVFGLEIGRGFDPAFICVDEALMRSLSDVREVNLSGAD